MKTKEESKRERKKERKKKSNEPGVSQSCRENRCSGTWNGWWLIPVLTMVGIATGAWSTVGTCRWIPAKAQAMKAKKQIMDFIFKNYIV